MFSGIICLVIGIFIGIALEKYAISKLQDDDEEKPEGRIGYRVLRCVGTGESNKDHEYKFSVIVRELERAGNLSKVKILDIGNCTDNHQREQVIRIIGKYVPTDTVEWQDESNEEKAEEVVNEE